jgi:cystathionine beta-lyase/cystathionine gamma-synthase
MGVDITWLDASCPEKVADAVRPETRLILCETPSNPLLKVLDIGFLREQADRSGALLAVDNTFATPCHQKPLKLGAHLVIHSATKAMGGHNDLMAGAIATCKDYYNELWFTRQAIGTTLDPFSAFLLQRGLKTLPLRAEKMSANALSLAEFLSGHKKVGNVSYPGLPDDPGHALAREQMEGGSGGVLAFDVGETLEDAQNFVNGLEHIYHAVSLGATESLVCVPYLSTMLYLPPERRLSFGVRKNTVRLSAGIENADLLKKDLEQALARI